MQTVLVADDDEFNLMVMESQLPQPPLQVRTAANGRLALAAAVQQRPDLIIMDIEMPVMGGEEAMRAIRAHQAQAGQTPVVQVKIGVINEVLCKKSAPAIHPGDVLADLIAQSAWCGTLPTPTGEDWSIDAEWWSQGMKWVRRNRHSTTT